MKRAFTSTPVLTHWVPDHPIIVETDASDYALGAILSIQTDSGEIHPVAFHSRSFTPAKINYDTHDKELLAIFAAFTVWRHYPEGSPIPIDAVTDHKNLEYFSTSKVLTCCQAHWSEYLSQFNLVMRFHPGCLSTKPDSLTRRWDVYPKEGNNDYAKVNPINFCPAFTQEQISTSLCATNLFEPVLAATVLMNQEQLYSDILCSLPSNLSTPTINSPLNLIGLQPLMVSYDTMISFTFPTPPTSISVYSATNMITYLLVILVKTKPLN